MPFSPTVPVYSLPPPGRHCDDDAVNCIVVFPKFSIVGQVALLADERILLSKALFPPVGPERAKQTLSQ